MRARHHHWCEAFLSGRDNQKVFDPIGVLKVVFAHFRLINRTVNPYQKW